MRKEQFIESLRNKLSGLPKKEVEERLAFYSEMIEDRMEEGLAEEAAVSAVGSVDEIAAQIVSDLPLLKIIKEKVRDKGRLSGLEIALLAVGFPIWFSLLVAGISVLISLVVVFWSLVIVLWATEVSLLACVVAAIPGSILFFATGNTLTGMRAHWFTKSGLIDPKHGKC